MSSVLTPERRTLHRWAGWVAVCLIASAFCFFSLELVLRTTHLFLMSFCPVQGDPQIGWRYAPEAPYRFHKENDHAVSGRMNRYGWRDINWSLEKSNRNFRVALLGDSMVEALQVESERTFAKGAEKILQAKGIPAEIMNFGRSGTPQAEEFLILKNDIARFRPDAVVLFFNPGNDIDDISRETDIYKMRPYYTVGPSGQLVLDTSFSATREYRVRSAVNALRKNSALVSLVAERIGAWQKSRKSQAKEARMAAAAGAGKISGSRSLATAHPDFLYTHNYETNKALLKAMSEFCRTQGIHFIVAVLPLGEPLPDSESSWRNLDPTFVTDFFEKDLRGFSDEIGAGFLGLSASFREDFKMNARRLYWDHLNYAGHDVVARALAEKLQSFLTFQEKE